MTQDTKNGAELAIVGAVALELGDTAKHDLKHLFRDEMRNAKGIARNLSVIASNAAGVFPPVAPRDTKIWMVRRIAVWITNPFAAGGGTNVAIFVGANYDTANTASGPNSECVIPAQPVPFFDKWANDTMVVRPSEGLYAVLSAAQQGYMSVMVSEYNISEYNAT